ncbi:MAG: hypothetical protein KDD36_10000 [Flavobacteriales bacterium]|nr:hypothetical protein [Flavobacteriales bacterium]
MLVTTEGSYFGIILTGVVVLIFLGVLIYKLKFGRDSIEVNLRGKAYKRISDYADGDNATLVGTVDFLDKPLISPLTGYKCCMYRIEVYEDSDGDQQNLSSFKEEVIPFVIRNGKEAALVFTSQSLIDVNMDTVDQTGLFKGLSPKVESYILAQGVTTKGMLGFRKTFTVKEGLIERREKVAVTGYGHWRAASDYKIKTGSGKVLVIQSDGNNPVYISDALTALRPFKR